MHAVINPSQKITMDQLTSDAASPPLIPFSKAVHDAIADRDRERLKGEWVLIEPSVAAKAQHLLRLRSPKVLAPEACSSSACERITLGLFCESLPAVSKEQAELLKELAAHAKHARHPGNEAMRVMQYLRDKL